MKKYFLELALIILACFFCCFVPGKGAFSIVINSEKEPDTINVRVTREEFADFHDTLIIEDRIIKLELEEFYFSDFDLVTGSFKHDAIFSNKNPKFQKDIFSGPRQKNKENVTATSQGRQGIHSIKLSGTTSPGNKRPVAKKDRPGVNLFSDLEQSEFTEKLKKAANLVKKQEDLPELELTLLEMEKFAGNKPQNLTNMGKVYLKAGNTQKACEFFSKAETLSPDDYKISYMHSICLYKMDELVKAEEKFKKVARLKPDFMYAYYNLGNLHYKKENYKKAIDSFKKAMELAPGNKDIYFNIGLTLENMGYTELAKKFYQKCLELDPTDKEAVKALEKLH